MPLASVAPGNVCLTAFVMDRFCIERGTLLDNPTVLTLENPGAHSVHCLVDVGVCISSPFELLTPPTSAAATEYTRAFVLDDDAKAAVIALNERSGSRDRRVTDLLFGVQSVRICSAAECVPARGSRGTPGLFPVPGNQGMA